MADQRFANRPVGNNRAGFHDVSLVEVADGAFAQLMALFAAWRADIDSEPFAYSDEEMLRAWRPLRLGRPELPATAVEGPEPPTTASPHRN